MSCTQTTSLVTNLLISMYSINIETRLSWSVLAHLSASEWLPSIVCSSVCKLSDFLFYLLNHQENFIQAWNKAFFGKGDSSLFK